jgi:ABC-type transport system involved in cytochrome c biogenesis permease subunit
MRERILYGIGIVAAALLVRNLWVILFVLPDEASQGAIYRIMYYHVPSWFTCFSAFLAAGIGSALYLVSETPCTTPSRWRPPRSASPFARSAW